MSLRMFYNSRLLANSSLILIVILFACTYLLGLHVIDNLVKPYLPMISTNYEDVSTGIQIDPMDEVDAHKPYNSVRLIKSPIKCERPYLMVNPYFRRMIFCFVAYKLPSPSGRVVSLSHVPIISEEQVDGYCKTLDAMHCHVSYMTYQKFYGLLPSGEKVPLYLCLPCGKCFMCARRRKNEWRVRVAAETQTTGSRPYFVTLTYNEFCRPPMGLVKSDVQKWLKRLRKAANDVNSEVSIRYFGCGEYGSRYKRPHYHFLLWNLDRLYPNDYAVYGAVARAWSVTFPLRKHAKEGFSWYAKKGGAYVPDDYLFLLDEVKGASLDHKKYIGRVPMGFVQCTPCTSGCSDYVVKYVLKKQYDEDGKSFHNPAIETCDSNLVTYSSFDFLSAPDEFSSIRFHPYAATGYGTFDVNVSAPFLLASRRPAIGKDWIVQHAADYRKVDAKMVSVTDPLSGKIVSSAFPLIYSRFLFPNSWTLMGAKLSEDVRAYARYLFRLDSIFEYCSLPRWTQPIINYLKVNFPDVDWTYYMCPLSTWIQGYNVEARKREFYLLPIEDDCGFVRNPTAIASVLASEFYKDSYAVVTQFGSVPLFNAVQLNLLRLTMSRSEYLRGLPDADVYDLERYKQDALRTLKRYEESDLF